MPEAVATKSEQGAKPQGKARQAAQRLRSPAQASEAPDQGVLSLQKSAGNVAVSELIEHPSQGARERYAGSPEIGLLGELGNGRSLPADAKSAIETAAGPIPRVSIHQDSEAQHVTDQGNAYAGARGSQIVAEPAALEGASGRFRLAHEVGHVLQQHSPNLPAGTGDQHEADADEFASDVTAGRHARIRFSSRIGWAYDEKDKPGLVTSIYVDKRGGAVYVSTLSGSYRYQLVRNNLPPGNYRALRESDGLFLTNADGSELKVGGDFSFGVVPKKDGPPAPAQLQFPGTPVPLTVVAGGAPAAVAPGSKGTAKTPGAPPTGSPTPGSTLKAKPDGSSQTTGAPTATAAGPTVPQEVSDFYKGTSIDPSKQIPTDELIRMYQLFVKYVHGKPTWGKTGESFKDWVDFFDKNGKQIQGQLEATEGGKLKLNILKRLTQELNEGDALQLPDKEEQELSKRAKDALQKEGKLKATSSPEWLLIPASERKLLLEVMEKHPDMFGDTTPKEQVRRITAEMKESLALQISAKYLPGDIGSSLKQIITSPEFWIGLAAMIEIYILLWLSPDPFTKVVVGGLTAYLLLKFGWDTLVGFAHAYSQLEDTCRYDARTGPELEQAAKVFADEVGQLDAQIIIFIALWFLGKAAETALPKPPVPPGKGGGTGGGGTGEGGGNTGTRPTSNSSGTGTEPVKPTGSTTTGNNSTAGQTPTGTAKPTQPAPVPDATQPTGTQSTAGQTPAATKPAQPAPVPDASKPTGTQSTAGQPPAATAKPAQPAPVPDATKPTGTQSTAGQTPAGTGKPPQPGPATDTVTPDPAPKPTKEGGGPSGEKTPEELQAEKLGKKAELELKRSQNKTKIDGLIRRIKKLTEQRTKLLDKQAAARGAERDALLDDALKNDDLIKDLEAQQKGLQRENSKLDDDIDRMNAQLHPEAKTEIPCFAPGTLVWTPAGRRAIDSLQPGDTVLAYDFISGNVVDGHILQVFSNRSEHFYEIHVADEMVLATGLHRFWVESESKWIPANRVRIGMKLKLFEGDQVVRAVELREGMDSRTFNLRIENLPNYFVGPGALVHNGGPLSYGWGTGTIYQATNPEFPGKVYVGKTDNPAEVRGGQHRGFARRQLQRTDLSAEDRAFFEFMKGADLEPVVTGLKPDQRDYMEQKNIDLERTARGPENVINRSNPVSKDRMKTLEGQIKNDPDVQKSGYCPKG